MADKKLLLFTKDLVFVTEFELRSPIKIDKEGIIFDGIGNVIQPDDNNFAIVDADFELNEGADIDSLCLPFKKERMRNIVNRNVNIACTKGFTSETTGFTFETDQHDQDNFTRRMLSVLGKPSIETVQWKTADGVTRSFTRDEFIAICYELDGFITPKVGKGWHIKNNLIEGAQTLAELDKISLEVE